MHEIIRFHELTVTFLKCAEETENQFCLCEFTVPPHRSPPLPHIHTECDQMVVGMDGIILWRVGREQITIGPGERLFIPRGTPHDFTNHQEYSARFACIYVPAVIGPDFFRELANTTNESDAARVAQIGSVMARFQTIPVARN